MTEHAAVIFVFFFLAEYASIILICILTSILFLGGYLIDYTLISLIIQYSYYDYVILNIISYMSSPLIEGMIYGLTIGIKTCVMVFVFIWVRASFPRIRFDQLMSFSWTILLPIVIAFIVLIPCILYSFDLIPSNICLL
jgi:NADH-ubiquinone oxidoreductase chain 1